MFSADKHSLGTSPARSEVPQLEADIAEVPLSTVSHLEPLSGCRTLPLTTNLT